MSVIEIKAAITELPETESAELIDWIEESKSDAWDRQIERDAKASRFDGILTRVQGQIEAGLSKPL